MVSGGGGHEPECPPSRSGPVMDIKYMYMNIKNLASGVQRISAYYASER